MSGPFISVPSTVTFTEDDPATIISPTAVVSDASGSPFDTLDVSITAPSADDVLGVEEDAGANEISLDTNTSEVLYNGVTIGTYTRVSDSHLTFNFNGSESDAAVQKLVQRITFFDASQTPDTTDRTIHFQLTDLGSETAQADATIHVASVNDAPVLHQEYTATFADAGTGFYSLRIAAPTDADGDTLTVTIDEVPQYGDVYYADGSNLIKLLGGETLTADQLASLQYFPAGDGEHGGGSLKYTVSDGTHADDVHGQIDIHDVGEEEATIGPLPSVFFSAVGPDPMTGPDLYFLSAIGGPPFSVPLRFDDTDPSTYTGSFAGEDGGFAHFNGLMLFLADFDSGSGVVPDQLMEIDPIDGPLPVAGVAGIFQKNAHFTVFGGNLYFEGDAGGGFDQLIKLAPDLTATTIVINAGHPAFATDDFGGFTEMGGSLYFAAISDANGNNTQNPDLIKLDLDGTVTPISTRSDPTTGSVAGADGGIFAFGNSIFFNAYDEDQGMTLFRLDAGSLTPETVDDGTHFSHTNGISTAFQIFDGNLYFNEQGVGGDTLFEIDGAGHLTTLDYLGNPLVSAGANGYGELNGSLYFTAFTPGTGTDLFKLDAGGTLTAIDLNPGSGDSNAGEWGGFIQFAGALYFFADDPANSGAETLFRMDANGVAAPVLAESSNASDTPLFSSQEDAHFTLFGDTLLLRALTADGDELVEILPDGSAFVDDIKDDGTGNSAPGQHGGFGIQGLTQLVGTNGNDILVGCDELDSLNGGPGNDLLTGRELNDVLTGGDGADIFKFSELGNDNFDLVTDYTLIAGDRVDLSDLLGDYDPGNGGVITDFVQTAVFQTGLLVFVNVNGTGLGSPDDWDVAAFLEGVSGQVQIITPVGDATIDPNPLPTVSLTGGTPTATERVPLILDSGITVGDDSGYLVSADVFITNATYAGPEDTFSVDPSILAGTFITAQDVGGELVLEGVDTVAHYMAVLQAVTYLNTSHAPDTSDRAIEITVNDGISDSLIVTETIHVVSVNETPTVGNAGNTVGYTENAAAVLLNGSISTDDTDDDNLQGATVVISNAVSGDRLTINGATSGSVAGADGTINYTFSGNTLTLTGDDSLADYQAALQLVKFDSTSDNPDALGTNQHRTIDWQVTDGHASNATSTVVHTTVDITASDDPAVAKNDAVGVLENGSLSGNLFADNGSGADADPDGPSFSIISVNGVPGAVGQQITLSSGAKLTVNANGTFSYDPNGSFDSLHLAPPGSGAANTQTTDGFAYAVTGGSTASVTVTITGVERADTIYRGSAGNDTIHGGSLAGHLYNLSDGGNDDVTGGEANDGFYFGTTFNGNDHVNGGEGTNDQLGLEGDYSGGVTLDGTLVTNVEALAMLPGFNYKITTLDNFVAAGKTFTFWSASMGAANHVDIDGSQESNGSFKFYLGQGNDIARGGNAGNLFYGEGGSDFLSAGGGADIFAYLGVSDSTGNTLDHISNFAAGTDKFKLPVSVAGIDTTVTGGGGNTPDEAVTAAIGSGQLAGHHAVIYNATTGDAGGHAYLVVDANGVAGYQSGQDFLFDLIAGTNLNSLGTGDFILG